MRVLTVRPELCTKLKIWAPRYSSAYTATKERVALLAQYKVQQASPVVLIDFTKAKHLLGQRYCIEKQTAMRYPTDSNGTIPCYAVPMSAFATWETPSEVRDIALKLFNEEGENL